MGDETLITDRNSRTVSGPVWVTLALAFMVIGVENFDMAVIGIAGPAIMREVGVDKVSFGFIVSSTMIGFLFGAPIGGGLGDRFGRGRAVAVALALLGGSGLATSFASSTAILAAARFCTGLAVGAATPNVYAIGASVMKPHQRALGVTIAVIGGGAGGTVVNLMVALGGDAIHWRTLFVIGGVCPLMLAPLALMFMPNIAQIQSHSADVVDNPLRVLFARERRLVTFSLWIATFCAALLVNVVVAWMPTIALERGFNLASAGWVNVVYGVGSMAGTLCLGILLDWGWRTRAFLILYGGVLSGLFIFAGAEQAASLLVASAFLGFFISGGQVVPYALPSLAYPAESRATGTGWAIAVGRVGAIVGPLAVGIAYQAGMSARSIVWALMPLAVLAPISLIVAFGQPLRRGSSRSAMSRSR